MSRQLWVTNVVSVVSERALCSWYSHGSLTPDVTGVSLCLCLCLCLCADINECVDNANMCLHGRCINRPGRHQCACFVGYQPAPDGTFCVGQSFSYYHTAPHVSSWQPTSSHYSLLLVPTITPPPRGDTSQRLPPIPLQKILLTLTDPQGLPSIHPSMFISGEFSQNE